MKKCENCKAWQRDPDDSTTGFCTKNPPQVFLMPQNGRVGFISIFPSTKPEGRCEQFDPQFEDVK